MPSSPPKAAPLVIRVPSPPTRAGTSDSASSSDDAGLQGRGEQGRAALAQHVPQPAPGQGVECGGEVDGAVTRDDHGIRTERLASGRERWAAGAPAGDQQTRPAPVNGAGEAVRHPR